ncbi:MAG TPA: STAS domain-containing protein [Candidatus Polarisedimenticolia bacterium]|nr:STAS domain-containing protein [Candidatus Polarisedimenticolia bacterium]
MPVSVRTRGDVSIIEVQGTPVDPPGAAPEPDARRRPSANLGDTLRRLLDEGERKIVLDVGELSLDSAGIGDLIAARKRAAQMGGDLLLLRPAGKLRGMLEMLSLTRILRVYDDEAEALASFDRDSRAPRPGQD